MGWRRAVVYRGISAALCRRGGEKRGDPDTKALAQVSPQRWKRRRRRSGPIISRSPHLKSISSLRFFPLSVRTSISVELWELEGGKAIKSELPSARRRYREKSEQQQLSSSLTPQKKPCMSREIPSIQVAKSERGERSRAFPLKNKCWSRINFPADQSICRS